MQRTVTYNTLRGLKSAESWSRQNLSPESQPCRLTNNTFAAAILGYTFAIRKIYLNDWAQAMSIGLAEDFHRMFSFKCFFWAALQ